MQNHIVLFGQIINTGSRISDIALLLTPILLLAVGVLVLFQTWRIHIRHRGYCGIVDYLLKVPQTDDQKLDAIGLTLKGVILCVVGWSFCAPIVLLGVIPVYCGVRKLMAIRLEIRKPGE